MNSISFTGHRNPSEKETILIRKRLRSVLEPLIISGSKDFYAGGAIGFDTLAAQTVLELKKKYPHIKLHMIYPCERDYQTKKWTAAQKKDYDIIRASADDEELIGAVYTDSCMKKRNAALIEKADILICWYDRKKEKSGTGQTVRMAENKNLTVINLFGQNSSVVEIR